jgi:hypothetical protein
MVQASGCWPLIVMCNVCAWIFLKRWHPWAITKCRAAVITTCGTPGVNPGLICGCSSVGRIHACQARGHGFEPRHPLQSALVVKWHNDAMVRRNRQFDSVLEHQLFHSGQSQGTEQADVHPANIEFKPASAESSTGRIKMVIVV